MAVDIALELSVIDNSKSGAEIKQAIWDALYKVSQAGPTVRRDLDIAPACDFAWGLIDCAIIAPVGDEEVSL